jgi:hypothetical protein
MCTEGYPVRRTAIACVLLLVPAAGTAQRLNTDDVVARLGAYIVSYESRLATVVAEEIYVQTLNGPGPRQVRRLRSDYVLTRAADRDVWVGFRDTFEMDGAAVRDRDGRLQRLLSSGARAQAARIAAENSRYNLANDVVTRNVNVPTFALEVLHPRNHWRLTFRRADTPDPDYPGTLELEFRERERPTVVRRPDGRDNPMRGTIRVETSTGEVTRTRVSWEALDGSVEVTYGRVEGIDVVVPLMMRETFRRGDTTISGEADYSNHRQFRTSGRLITP